MRNGGQAQSIVDSAFQEVARQAVRDAIADHVGSGVDSEVKEAIRAEAMRLTKEDAEVRKAIRDRLLYWIAQA